MVVKKESKGSKLRESKSTPGREEKHDGASEKWAVRRVRCSSEKKTDGVKWASCGSEVLEREVGDGRREEDGGRAQPFEAR